MTKHFYGSLQEPLAARGKGSSSSAAANFSTQINTYAKQLAEGSREGEYCTMSAPYEAFAGALDPFEPLGRIIASLSARRAQRWWWRPIIVVLVQARH